MSAEMFLLALGLLFLAGLGLDALGRYMHVPRVTLMVLLGVLIGPPGFDLFPFDLAFAYDVLAPTALTMVAFLMGGTLDRNSLAEQGRAFLILSVCLVLGTASLVAIGLVAVGTPVILALLLAGISTATAPDATLDALRQAGAKNTRFGRVLTGVVALDDAMGAVVFAALMTVALFLSGSGGLAALLDAGRELFGAVLLGLAVGLPGAVVTGRLKPGEPTLLEALGLVFAIAGLALWLDLSVLIAGMTAGAVIVNLARHHDQPFHEIDRIEWPFLLLFFVTAGASLHLDALAAAGWVGVGYVVFRMTGRILSGGLAGPLVGLSRASGFRAGTALLPQAGIALGFALFAVGRFPEHGETLLAVTIAATVVFEVIGPPLTLWAASKENRPAP